MSEHPDRSIVAFPEADLNILKRLERLPFGPPHIRLLFIGGLGFSCDAVDAGLIAFILVPVVKLWGLSSVQAGMLGSAMLVGYMIGAFSAGTLGDIIGRRAVMMYALIVYCVATLFAAFSMNYEFLYWTRVVSGIGIGAESAIISPYLSEFIPSKFRGRFLGSLAGFMSFGWVIAAILGYFVVPAFSQGWRIIQIVAALPIFLLLWWRRSLPESPRWLIQRKRSDEALKIVENMEERIKQKGKSLPSFENVEIPLAGAARRAGTFWQNLAKLWRRDLIRTTSMLWVLWITFTFTYYGFFVWIPTLLVKQGMTITKSFGFSVFIYLAQIPGYYSAAFLMEKLDRKWTIVLYMLFGGISAYLLSIAKLDSLVVLFGCCLSFGMNGLSAGIYAYTPELYPTDIRTTGMGVASSFARLGGLAAPIVIGFTYAHVGFVGVFTVINLVMIFGAVVVAIFGIRTAGRSLEQIAARKMEASVEGAKTVPILQQ